MKRTTTPRPLAILAILLTFSLCLAPAAFADEPMDWSARSVRTHYLGQGKALTLPTKAAAPNVVSSYLARGQVSLDAVESLRVERQIPSFEGMVHVRMTQEVDGLEVFGTYAKAAVDAEGRLVHLIENLVSVRGGVLPARVDAADALAATLESLHPRHTKSSLAAVSVDGVTTTFARPFDFHNEPTVKRVAIPMKSGRLVEGFLVETWTDEDNLLHHTLVDGAGRVLGSQLRTNTDTYNIFPDHPDNSSQTVVSGPGSGNAESPNGWVFNDTTTGNNVDAYLDRDNNNASDGRPVSSTQNFEYTANLSQDPTTSVNQDAAVANLFYFNNVIHDKLYRHGFVESAGNFQEDNFGNGGSGSDSVNAEAQDGGGTNNANFATPSDGSNPRMQMYIWTYSTPNRDGDLDSDIIWHEYGHGLTWRMIGNMSGGLSGAIGEGMSDVLSIYINGNDVVGEYSFNDPGGIRRYPYGSHPLTYGDVTGSSVHADGEIYAATMWDLRGLWLGAGYTMDQLFDVVVGGMNFTPSGPAYEDMRDGLLAASSTQDQDCLIWEAFAARGIGVNASGSVSGGGGPFGGGSVSITEDFTVPSTCSGGCVVTENPEVSCSDGVDNDCDGAVDNADTDCGGGSCTAIGDSCTDDVDCCSGNCSNGRPSSRVCQ